MTQNSRSPKRAIFAAVLSSTRKAFKMKGTFSIRFAELGANLLGQERVQPGGQGPEEGSTSGVSTVNSVKSQKAGDLIDNKYWKEYRDQMGALKMENMKLLQELIESQKSYQVLLQQALEEQKAQVNTLTRLCENLNRKTTSQESG